MDARSVVRGAMAVVRRPELWSTAVRVVWRLRRRRWWASSPHLPTPSPDYLRFRLLTAYGSGDAAPDPDDLVTWLRWCRSWPLVRR